MSDYKVEHITNAGVIKDVSTHIHSVDYVRKYSDGRISTASFTLKASFGKFMTDSSGGDTPIIKNFDRFRITGTDDNGKEYKHIFVVTTDLGQLNRQSEYLLPLTLEGRERWLSGMPFSGYFDAENHFDMVELILKTYGVSKRLLQPIIDTQDDSLAETNLLPLFNPNIWDFQYIDNCLDAIKVVVRLANQSVAAGGGGDRFAIIFEDSKGCPCTIDG